MKLTWKKQIKNKNNKRPLSSISLFPNLPFQQDDDPKSEQSKADGTEPGLNGDVCHSTQDASSSDRETTQLAESFREQGNKLAEVISHFFPSWVIDANSKIITILYCKFVFGFMLNLYVNTCNWANAELGV